MDHDEFEDITGGSADGGYHGSSAWNDDLPEEFDLEGELGGDDWLANHDAETEVLDIEGRNPQMGMATAADLMTGRFSHMEAGVREAAKNITGNNVPAHMGFDPIDILAAREGFSSTIEGSAEAWGRALASTDGQLGGAVTRIDPVTMKPMGTFQPDVSRKDYVVALSMLDVTANEYLEKGAGENLLGHSLVGDRVDKSDENLVKANEISGRIASLYLSAATKDSDISEARLASVQNAVIKRAISSSGISTLGLPNELSTSGLVRTQIYGGTGQGTALTSEEHLRKFDQYTVKNAFGFQELLVGTPENVVKDYWATKGSVKDSLFPLARSTKANPISDDDRANSKKLQQIQYDQLKEDAKFLRDTYRLALTGETTGRASRTFNDRTLGLQAEASYLKDDAAILDKEYTSRDDTSKSRKIVREEGTDIVAGQTLSGSATGGMYGDKETSESQDFVTEGLSIDQIIANEERDIANEFVGPRFMTDRDVYLSSVANSNSAAQGTKEWLEEREGHVTASMFASTSAKYKAQDLAIALASERMGIKGFAGNSDTREGNDSEGKVAFALMSHLNKGTGTKTVNTDGTITWGTPMPKSESMSFEEAFFFKGAKGMGASVDGRMFNPDGSSSGNVELKYLSGGSVEGARKKYYEQMQFQMMMNDESQTHFGVLDKGTNQFHYELIHADPKTQAALRASAEEALAAQGDITAKDIQAMKKARSRKPTQPVERATGQSKAFEEVVPEVDDSMTAFDPTGAIRPSAPEMSARDSLLGQRNINEDQHAAKIDLDNINRIKFDKSPEGLAEKKAQADKTAQVTESADRKMALLSMAATKTKEGEDRDLGLQHVSALAEDAKRASEALKGFKKALGKIGTVVTELAERLLKGNEEGMEISRLASSTGLKDENALGLRDMLRSSGLSKGGSVNAMLTAGRHRTALDVPADGAALLSDMQIKSAATGFDLDIPTSLYEGVESTQELLAAYEGLIQDAGLDKEQRATAYNTVFEIPEMANFRGSPKDILEAYKTFDLEGTIATNKGIEGVKQFEQAGERSLGSSGKIAGATAQTKVLLDKSPTASMGIGALTTGAIGLATGATATATAAKMMAGTSKASAILTAAKGPAATAATKALSIAAKGSTALLRTGAMLATSPAGLAIGAGTAGYAIGTGIREVMSEDSKASLASGVGWAVDSTLALFGSDDAQDRLDLMFPDEIIPSEEIGNIASTPRDGGKTTVNSSVEVNVQVNPDSVVTEVNDNGFTTIDTDNTLGLGGYE